MTDELVRLPPHRRRSGWYGLSAAGSVRGVNLRTFLPPESRATTRPPEVGEEAPELPAGAGEEDRPRVLAFLRHTGCPFAEATMRSMREAAAREPGVHFVAVSHSPSEATESWCEAVGGRGRVHLVADEDRSAYQRWGLGRTSLAHFMGARSMRSVARLAREGIRNRHPDGTRWQRAGTFAVGADGTVRWRHLPDHAGELPDLDRAADAVHESR